MRLLRCLAVMLLTVGLAAPARAEGELTVFAAASLTDALGEIAALYEAETGRTVRLSFASSSALARQIEAGAPADIFAAADVAWMDYLAERGLVEAESVTGPIGNGLVLVAPAESNAPELELGPGADLLAALGDDGRLAMGDPAHVPAGIYARQALEHLGIWEQIEPRLARAESVRSALALVDLGETPLGIVYRTDAMIAPGVAILGTFPPESHAPVTYPFAIVAGRASPEVEDLFAFVTGEPGLAVFSRFGFVVP